MRRIADFGFDPHWIGYETGWVYTDMSVFDIAQIRLHVKTNKGDLWYVDKAKTPWYTGGAFHVTIAVNPVEITGLKIRDNCFEGSYTFKDKRGIIQGEVDSSKYLLVRHRHTNIDNPEWHQRYMAPATTLADKVNSNLKPGNRCLLRMQRSSVGVFKMLNFNGGQIEIKDVANAWLTEYRFSGVSVEAAIGSPIDPGDWTEWVECYPKWSAANEWDGMRITFKNAIGLGKAMVITDNNSRNVLEIPLDDFGSAFSGVDVAGLGTAKLTLVGQYSSD